MLAGGEAKATNGDKTEEHERKSSHVDGRSAEAGEQEPTNDAAHDVARGKRNVQIERCDGSKTRCFQEHHAVAQDRVTAENLSCPNYTVLLMLVTLWL